MPRPLREQLAGGVYHVFARGNNRRVIFCDDRDRRTYLVYLAAVIRRHGWRCLAYCLMRNHVHLVVETPEPNLAHGMQRLHGDYAQQFNRRHKRVGHLFQGRYGSVRVRSDGQLWAVLRYVVLNPVAAGYCAAAADYPWSSHAAVLHGVSSPCVDVRDLLDRVAAATGSNRPLTERYGELVDDASPATGITAS